jgi:tyrosinase
MGALSNAQNPRTMRDPEPPDELPRATTIRAVLLAPTFQAFTEQLENVLNAVHVWVAASMGQIPVAAHGPIFWAHHCMIDRLWYLRQLQHPGADPPLTLINRALPPFPLTVADTLNITQLGYSDSVQVVG